RSSHPGPCRPGRPLRNPSELHCSRDNPDRAEQAAYPLGSAAGSRRIASDQASRNAGGRRPRSALSRLRRCSLDCRRYPGRRRWGGHGLKPRHSRSYCIHANKGCINMLVRVRGGSTKQNCQATAYETAKPTYESHVCPPISLCPFSFDGCFDGAGTTHAGIPPPCLACPSPCRSLERERPRARPFIGKAHAPGVMGGGLSTGACPRAGESTPHFSSFSRETGSVTARQ